MGKQRNQRVRKATPQPPHSQTEYQDQPLAGGWKVLIPGSGVSYADYVPPEKRGGHCHVSTPEPENSVPN